MDMLQGIILGVVQGITEFLPISSSGHLVIMQHFLGMEEPMLFFDIMLHLGTLGAVVAVFWGDIKEMGQEELLPILKGFANTGGLFSTLCRARMILLILLASIPTGLIGYLFKKPLESLFSSPHAVGFALCFTGTLLWLTKYGKRQVGPLRVYHALLIGLVQGIAIIPGISRSGATIATGLFLGLSGELAARFSFLLSIPAILGAVSLELASSSVSIHTQLLPTVLGTFMATLIGYLALRYLLKVISHGKLFHFSYYCWALGILTLIL
jgi:undecaprenyl-diphosphatase